MSHARGVISQRERQQEAYRTAKREYMRRWRAAPENRAQMIAMQQAQNARRKVERSRDTGERTCSFCRRRPPVKRIERMIATNAGFKSVFVLCCAQCLV